MKELEKCPFCGFEDAQVEQDGRWCFVYCNCCECRGPSSPTKHRAEVAWNLWPDKARCSEGGEHDL